MKKKSLPYKKTLIAACILGVLLGAVFLANVHRKRMSDLYEIGMDYINHNEIEKGIKFIRLGLIPRPLGRL